jgi:hypothetical protein
MRILIVAAALLTTAMAAPASARDYPWCARTTSNGFNGDCSFTSFRQCEATVSGQGGDCISNPRMAFDQARGARGRSRGLQHNGWDNGHWDNGNRW